MPSVTIVLPSLNTGGAERVGLTLAKALKDRGHETCLALIAHEGGLLADLPHGVPTLDLGGNNRTAVTALRRHLDEKRPDALLTILDASALVALLARKGASHPVRTVASIHSVPTRIYGRTRELYLFRRLVMLRLWLRRAELVVGVSEGVSRELVSFFKVPKAKVRTIPNPAIWPDSEESAHKSVDEPWFTDGGSAVIVAAGRLIPLKRFDVLLEAMAKVPQARLILLGEGPELGALTVLRDRLGLQDRVRFAGFVRTPQAWMARARLVVSASAYESFGMTLVEAMAAGTPVVSTDCPYGPAEILEQGRYGTLVPVDDAEALATAIQNELAHAKTSPPRQAWEPYQLTRVINQYEEALFP